MDFNNLGRASSAGYRLPVQAVAKQQAPKAAKSLRSTRDRTSTTRETDVKDPVKQDQAWKAIVWGERRAVLEWEKNWSFLRNYDQMGELKPEEPLPNNASHFSDCVPNTTNQIFGSRLSTPLGRELVRLDRLLSSSASHHKCKQDPEMIQC
ncbi:uncharacterized protein C2orf50 homolog [Dunckerocampus dactyliophorus]|uniref:uncharacterized protein C2orf50 homolog n=1 Tax=Dunckerocampus dactyliophorus TaxID=161453 RepID=UPI002404EE7B|nr:uncharacterized protein C2orf50 homolog [Dunckerocampus dactyliophorus]